MFHAPTSETKQQSDSPRTQLQPGYAPMRGRQQLAHLHSTYGNQAVLRMLSRTAPAMQTKLTVNRPGDPFEQEADRVADQVMRMPAPALSIQRKCTGCEEEEKLQRKCAECEEEEKKGELHRKETNAGPQFAPPSVHQVLNSPGHPLDPATRAFMEPRFGRDFNAVRIHTDRPAAESAQAVSALAYTSGDHIVFGAGQYSPAGADGRRLLAHELVHVVQQSNTIRRACDLALVGARPDPVFFPKQAKLADVFSGGSTLKKGSTEKEAIGLIQQALSDICFDEGIWGPNKDGVDRTFAGDTEKAVQAFQKSETLPDTGEVEKDTLRCLDETRSKRTVPCKTGVAVKPEDLLIEKQRAGGTDEDIFFERGDKTLDVTNQGKIAKVAVAQKDKPVTLTGFESEDELLDFGDKLADERVKAVSAELKKDGQGDDDAKLRKPDPQPQASTGVLSYRDRRKVKIIPAGGPKPADCKTIPAGWAHPDFGPCDAATEPLVIKAIDRGVKLMTDAIDALKPGDATAEKAVADRFGDKKHLPVIKTKLTTWKGHLDMFVRGHHECTNACHSACVGTGAYTDGSKDTFLCEAIIRGLTDPAKDEDALLLVHEAGHGALGTKDVAYDNTRLLSLIQKDFSLAEINTDSFVLLIQCLNGIVINGMGCTVPMPGDTFTGMAPGPVAGPAGPLEKSQEALAWLERWMDFVWQDVNNLYAAVVKARKAGKWDPDDSDEMNRMDLLAKDFGLHRPEGSPAPTMREETEVAAIHDRFFRLSQLTEKSKARDFKRDDAASPEWKEAPPQVVVNKAFFDLKTARERVRFLVDLLVKAQPDISAAAAPAYIAFTADDAVKWFNKP